VNPGDRVTVKVLEINLEKHQIALTMKSGNPVPRRERAQNADQAKGGKAKNDPRLDRESKSPKAFNNPFANLKSLGDRQK
jgi:transcriptional accessory protein Tex/SPT6